jgi:mediator of RNA polymerase II transcription subunit 31
VELEFVQSLANPNYLNFLAQRDYFRSPAFLNYVKYLLYWKEPEYIKYLTYPQCIYLLEMLQHKEFVKEIVNAQCAKFIDEQMTLLWFHYKRRREWNDVDYVKLNDIEDDDDNNNNNENADEKHHKNYLRKLIKKLILIDKNKKNNSIGNNNNNDISSTSPKPPILFRENTLIANEKY